MKCHMMLFHQFAREKKHVPKIYFTIEMQPNIIFKDISCSGCNLREGQFRCFCFQYDYSFFESIFHQAQVNGQWKRIIRS